MELITKDECQKTVDLLDQLIEKVKKIMSINKPMLNGERYLTATEVCQFLNITKRTLQDYRDSRIIPYIMISGKTLYKESDLIKLLEEHYIPTTSN